MLKEEPWQLTSWMQKKERKKGNCLLRLVVDALPDDRDGVAIKDLPVSFHPEDRRYAYRAVKRTSAGCSGKFFAQRDRA